MRKKPLASAPVEEKLSNNMKGGLPKRPTVTLEKKEPSVNKYSIEYGINNVHYDVMCCVYLHKYMYFLAYTTYRNIQI